MVSDTSLQPCYLCRLWAFCWISIINSVRFSPSVMSDSAAPWTAARQASLSITDSWTLLKLMSMESVMLSNHPILCCPLFLLPSIFPSIRVFSNESVLRIRWPKYWSFSLSTPLSLTFFLTKGLLFLLIFSQTVIFSFIDILYCFSFSFSLISTLISALLFAPLDLICSPLSSF